MSRRNATFRSKVGETRVGEMGVGEQGPIRFKDEASILWYFNLEKVLYSLAS